MIKTTALECLRVACLLLGAGCVVALFVKFFSWLFADDAVKDREAGQNPDKTPGKPVRNK